MALKVAVYQIKDHHRSAVVCSAMRTGIAKVGDEVIARFEDEYTEVEADVAVFYGLDGNMGRLFKEYRRNAKAVYIDLGYWKRKEYPHRYAGYHKICVNDRHPTAYFQKVAHDNSRVAALGLKLEPWKHGRHILLAGMGDKGAKAEGYDVEEWERWAIKMIRENTKREIVYRPKPSWRRACPIAGVGFSSRNVPIEKALKDCHAVVTHHSNVAVDALCSGIQAYACKGAAAPLALRDLSFINKSYCPDREQWLNDLSWCQWNIEEMKEGVPWKHLKEEGLV